MPLSLTFNYYNFLIIASYVSVIIWKQWFTSVSDTGMEVYFKLAYFNEWSHSAVGQSAYVIMPNFAKLIAIPFPFKK